MLTNRQFAQKIENRRKSTVSVGIVLLMITSTWLAMIADLSEEKEVETTLVDADPLTMSEMQSTPQSGQGAWHGGMTAQYGLDLHDALWDMTWSDPGVMYGGIEDLSVLSLDAGYGMYLEESGKDDHDNDGIDDLNDLDDDNDGIYDLLERFDGCIGTDPYDHDNDGILDNEDWDDDNDGILEGPIDYDALEALGLDPRNVSMHRYVEASTIHPLTGQIVGEFYRADQQPFDHDNDGVEDEDADGSGAGRYDEDDDNDGRIDQFRWPCDYDNDGDQDYFDNDDDDDGVQDWEDENPYDASVTGAMSSSGNLYSVAQAWEFNDYRMYSAGVNFVTLESSRVDANDDFDWEGGENGDGAAGTPAFTNIVDGDLDGDGIPNFIDPDNDNDDTPDSADTDDDNDDLLDMYDPDDDNDGIPDVCWNIDTNEDGLNDYTGLNSTPYQTPGADTDGVAGIDCEIDYDGDLDDDRFRAIDQNYNAIWDWLDPDMGGSPTPDDAVQTQFDALDFAYDIDNDQIENENDSFPLDQNSEAWMATCPSFSNPNPPNPDARCTTQRASFASFNDWDGDGISNWDDVDDDGDGILDMIDIDWDCDFDNDADLHSINGSKYRDDGPNDVDSDIDGDGLSNDIDWDDDNDGITDLYDPDDGNCGVVDFDATDTFANPYYPVGDGGLLDGSADNQDYQDNTDAYWSLVFNTNPFSEVVLNYNGFDLTTNPPTGGTIPEFYWFMYARWSPYNGGNEWDIDADGDSLVNGLDTDQDADGMPDWWDQDEGNDGLLDVNDPKMGGSIDMEQCGWTVGSLGSGYTCGYAYAVAYHMPLTGTNAQFGSPYSTRPDAAVDQGNGGTGLWGCTSGAQGGCWHYDFGGDGSTESAISYSQISDNRDAFLTWMGLTIGLWQWNFDNGTDAANKDWPDELGADLAKNDVDGDVDGDFTNNSIDIDEDYDAIYDWTDVDDDNDGVWDFFEIDSDDDLDNDANQNNGNFFSGTNCDDLDDDGNDQDIDGDGWFQAVWDKGIMSQGLKSPKFYDVDNDNDGIPDAEDPDDDNNGVLDSVQEQQPGCFIGEEQHPYDHDNDGIVDWADNDFDGDGITNLVEAAISLTAPFDHDNDGLRDDMDDDDDEDGMNDIDEVLLWPLRFDRESTNPWDHDDFGEGLGIANPLDPSTGPDAIDNDDDNDSREDNDWDHLEETYTADPCYAGQQSSDWDHDNDCILDADDKAPTYITLNMPDTLWLDARSPAIFSGHVDWLNPVTSVIEPAPGLPVQVHIEWTGNNTTAIETIDVLTNPWGNFSVGQFLYPEDLVVGDNTTYRIYAEVTEMFAFNGNTSASYLIGCEANLTVDYSAWTYFRSDEQPFWLDFKAHYAADWTRGFYDTPIKNAPITFEIVGGEFGNRSNPSNFTGFGNNGYRTDETGWASLTFVQNLGANGTWKQVQWNSVADNGIGNISGAYEEIVWNDATKKHDTIDDGTGNATRYDYTNTSLPAGDIEIKAYVRPELADEWPFPHLYGNSTDSFSVRIMHRMNIEGEVILSGLSPVYYWDSTINNGDGTFGNWATLFHEKALAEAGVSFNDAKLLKPYPSQWDGDLDNLTGEATRLRGFISIENLDGSENLTHWFISFVNGGDSDLPPCGQIDPSDPNSPVRCEIIPEMNTGETLGVRGVVTNRTNEAWDQDPIALQVDIDNNGQFLGSGETAFTQRPVMKDGDATFEYNWTWFSQYAAGTYGMRVDFTNNAYYYTGNSTNLAATGAYINVSVVGTTQFQMTSVPRLYRNSTTMIEARLLDNSLQPVRTVPITWTWSFDGRTGTNYTDEMGTFSIPFDINPDDALGNYSLQFEYEGTRLMKGNTASQSVWVVSRTYINVISAEPNIRQSGDRWDFTAQVTDDNKTAFVRDAGGRELSGSGTPNGGLVDVIFEGQDFEGMLHRQVVATLAPNAGLISLPEPQPDGSHLCFYDGNGDSIPDRDTDGNGQLDDSESIGCLKANISPLNPQLLREDPDSFLPDGFGPVSVYLRFRETLPNEGCEILEPAYLTLQTKWDPCVDIPGNDHFRIQMSYNANGFSLIGRTSIDVDDQIVYTSQINPLTGEVEPKPMIVTGKLTDELDTNLTFRNMRVNYEMVNSPAGPVACYNGITDFDGNFAITCPLSDVMAGVARVSVTYSAWNNNDAYRYQNKTVQVEFAVFSNSTLMVSEVGPFKSSVETFYAENNGTYFPVLYLKESFHIDAILTQSNGQSVGGKCLNIYLDPQDNVRPVSSISTRESDGMIEWFSGDPSQNPSLKGVETTGGKLEGFRLLRVAFEPDLNVPGGCDKDTSNVLNGSHMDIVVLVRSRVDLQVKTTWSHVNNNGLDTGEDVFGEVSLLRDRLDLAVENEEIWFVRQYWDSDSNEWVTEGRNESFTNEQGQAEFTWKFAGKTCAGEACLGEWRIIAYYPGSTFYAESSDNITHEVHYEKSIQDAASAGIFTPSTIMAIIIVLLGAAIAGVMYYQRVVARRQVEALRGILTDTMLQLQAANEYIAIIFDCYKQLVKHFRRHGFMKKVYETTREFENAVRNAFHMVPADQLDGFIAIFEEARYSDHEIGPSHRDRATQTLGAITQSLAMSLGDGGMISRTAEHESGLYGGHTKAGEFVAADGSVMLAGVSDDPDQSNFKI